MALRGLDAETMKRFLEVRLRGLERWIRAGEPSSINVLRLLTSQWARAVASRQMDREAADSEAPDTVTR